MPRKPKKRAYDSTLRQSAASATRQSILDAARQVFTSKGYAAATMPAIAEAAGVALDTVYATVGKKPALFRLLIEMAISGIDRAVPAEERDYVRAVRAATGGAKKLQIYAAALGEIQPRLAPLFRVLQGAATLDHELKALWQEISTRRSRNMHLLAKDLASTGELRTDLSEDQVADIIWSMNSPEFYLLLVEERGWTAEQFAHWLGEAWIRLLLRG